MPLVAVFCIIWFVANLKMVIFTLSEASENSKTVILDYTTMVLTVEMTVFPWSVR